MPSQAAFVKNLIKLILAFNVVFVLGLCLLFKLPEVVKASYVDTIDGQLGEASCFVLRGWAADSDNLNTSIDVHFYADGPSGTGQAVGTVAANVSREQAVCTQLGSNRNNCPYGFQYNIPDRLKDGRPHTIYAYGINLPGTTGRNRLLSGSPITITCIPPDFSSDLDGDNDVDIFDYNMLVPKYGRGYGNSEYQKFISEVGTINYRPNIIVIETDDQDDMGSLSVMTNVKNLLINQGVRFTNSFATNPVCCPSRTTFLTGQLTHNHTIWGGGARSGFEEKFQLREENSLPVWLQSVGYSTVLIGKYLNLYGRFIPPHVPPGWSNWHGLIDPSTYAYYGYSIYENGVTNTYGNNPEDYQTDVLSKKAVNYINSHKNNSRPFFMWLTPLAPHAGKPAENLAEPAPRHKGRFNNLTLPIPPSFNESDISDKPPFMQENPLMDQRLVQVATDSFRTRRESLLAVDEMVAAVIESVKQAGKLDNTYIIFTSDNGYFHGEHRIPLIKLLAYEESIKVPLVIKGPGIPQGQTRSQMVLNTDVTATIVELAKAKATEKLDGESFIKYARNPATPGKTAVILEGLTWLPWWSKMYGFYYSLRTPQFKYIEHTPNTAGVSDPYAYELYDLSRDRYELQNQVDNPSYASVLNSLRTALGRVKACIGVECLITSTFPQPPNTTLDIRSENSVISTTSTSGVYKLDERPVIDIEESALSTEERSRYNSNN